MSDESFIYVRNTASGVTEALTVDEAAHRLSHAWFKKFHVVVDKPKDEVLAQPYQVDDDGNRIPIGEPAEEVTSDEIPDGEPTDEDEN
jgi:hypothetical protein